MAVVLGADGCRDGDWVVAEVGGDGVRWHRADDAHQILALARRLGASAVALDVPIGLPEQGLRACDVQARRRLRGARASSVFAAPTRGVLALTSYPDARRYLPSLSAQTFALVARIRDVDEALLAAGPAVHHRVVECHPELSLQTMSGTRLAGKRSAPGVLQRMTVLRRQFGDLPDDAPPRARIDDALDALACAWTAGRWALGTAEVLGDETDVTGAPMRIVV